MTTNIHDAVVWLFVPGDRPERYAKAADAGDVVIVDLQDAVAPQRKQQARANAVALLDAGASMCVRINPLATQHGVADLAALQEWASARRSDGESCEGLVAVMTPMTESAADLDRLDETLGHTPVVALVETARGVTAVSDIAAHPRTALVAFGNLDMAADLGCGPSSPAIDVVRSQIVLACRVAGLDAPVDGVTADYTDTDVIAADALRARRDGFGAKLCIHPRQVDVVRAAFAPTEAERAWAQRVVAAVEAVDGGVAIVDGLMVDAPVLRRAATLLARPAAKDDR